MASLPDAAPDRAFRERARPAALVARAVETEVDLLVLTTIGARSGRVRENRLAFIRHGQDLVVVASNYGSPSSPHWYHNLVANPVVTVEVFGDRIQARARVARRLEREMLYALLPHRMPGFLQAQRRDAPPDPDHCDGGIGRIAAFMRTAE